MSANLQSGGILVSRPAQETHILKQYNKMNSISGHNPFKSAVGLQLANGRDPETRDDPNSRWFIYLVAGG